MSKMLEEMAGRIREETNLRAAGNEVACCACPGTCGSHTICPRTDEDDGALMLARWAVKLVAEELISEGVWAWLTANKDEQLFDRNAARLGKALVCLVAEAVKEAADGR